MDGYRPEFIIFDELVLEGVEQMAEFQEQFDKEMAATQTRLDEHHKRMDNWRPRLLNRERGERS